MRALIWLSFLAAGLSACSPTFVVMRNPETGQLAECRPDDDVASLPKLQMGTDDCVQAYAKQGYQAAIP